MVQNSKCLVTGGLGFLGSWLVQSLLQNEMKVTIVDNMSNPAIGLDNGSRFRGCFVIQSDVDQYVPLQKFDYIFHLADPVGPAGILGFAGNLGKSILDNGLHIGNIAAEMGARLIFVSTSEVYGDTANFSEDASKVVSGKVEVRTEYGVGKLLTEIALTNLGRIKKLKYQIIRPFNIGGPRQNAAGGFVIPRFVQSALRGEPITVFGDGSQRRAFAHVRDIVSGIILIASSELENEIWNLGNPSNSTAILALAHKIVLAVGSKSPVRCTNPCDIYGELYAEAFDKIPNIEKIQTLLSWQPKFSLDTIISDVIEYEDRC